MVSIQTFLIPPQQSLPEVYACMGTDQLQKLFITAEHFESVYAIWSDDIPLKINELNIAVIIQDDHQQLIGFEQWGLDLWGCYLSALNSYIKSGFTYGEAMYGIDPKLICFEKNGKSSIEVILKYDPLHVKKTITSFILEERDFLQHLMNGASNFYTLMNKYKIHTSKKTMSFLSETIELLKQTYSKEL
ncbi:hypothetical protein EL84_00305 [Paenibacillus sp. VT-400]|uniref:hypothetical protein n=1 Tax=Paenibacillus sp. VT-400 TaxID=1495853 RepID=UPI00064AC001|nr:hypothetical protein [Paenibacillus sp. VT-400]KLU58246.1 hypothetical protein EL84_00305 [Paenibacillus sp. VT-400]